ncbi:ATP-binding protein [Klebsiella oxytoca]|uniref:BbrUII/HgiDII family restriction enzyme n=1 Tax=Klebsiella oxytoca TaxID=571 RepID=UPI001643FF13|nr:ATP-binding protein [Klebsiella oxytoca]MBC4277095.1 ATP-binding protein [Klebsiella pneumoniae]MBG2575831.1 ATP-binding protein [Klebsiella oxytoca]
MENSTLERKNTETEHIYTMQVGLSVLGHLGINLYSNVAAVLTEAVANAWDADATRVDISLNENEIIIKDNGFGMTVDDMNKRYLYVGYSKRNKPELRLTPMGRKPMGRKGIGKLSLFSIANSVEVSSFKDGQLHGLIMHADEIQKEIDNGGSNYHPTPLDVEFLTIDSGTQIVLRELKKKRLSLTASALRKKIARRFSVIGSESFKVFVDSTEITIKDREDLSNLQFFWDMDSGINFTRVCPELKNSTKLPTNLEKAPNPAWVIKGWIGSVKSSGQLKSPEGNLNNIIVLSRGRLFQENILEDINDGGLYTKYLTGQLEADFLDTDEEDDIATSDRQRVVQDDERYQYLLAFLKQTMRKIAGQWSAWREETGVEEATDANPILSNWLDSLAGGSQPHAKKLLARIESLPLDDDSKKRELFKHAIFAFERLRIQEMSAELADDMVLDASKLLPLLAKQDDLEATLYYEIAKSRVDVIKQFENLVDKNEKEKVLQKYLFTHLWLLDPSWERANGTERMETNVQKEWEDIDADLSDDEKKGRLDIKYRNAAGVHLIIELKRASVKTSAYALTGQGAKYKQAVEKCARKAEPNKEPHVQVIFVLGEEISDIDRGQKWVDSMMEGVNGRIVYYETLIDGALRSYGDYLQKQEKIAQIVKLVSQL